MILSNNYVFNKDKNAKEVKFLIKSLLNVSVLSIYLIGMALAASNVLLALTLIKIPALVLK